MTEPVHDLSRLRIDRDRPSASSSRALIALPLNGFITSTTNWNSFSEIAFAFRITPELLLNGVIFAVVMGVIGGFLPAWRGSRQTVAEALRGV